MKKHLLFLLLPLTARLTVANNNSCDPGCECRSNSNIAQASCQFEVYCDDDTNKKNTLPFHFPTKADCIEIHLSPPTSTGWSTQEKTHFFNALPSGLRHLDLSFSGLHSFAQINDGKPFERFSNLIFLNLEFNKLIKLDKYIFEGLTSLRVLWLTGNHIDPDEVQYTEALLFQNELSSIHINTFTPVRFNFYSFYPKSIVLVL